MKHWIIASVTLAWAYANVAKVTEPEAQNKTKRGLSEQIHLYGDPSGNKAPIPYQDQQAVPTSPSLVAYYANNQKPFIFTNPPSQTKQAFAETDPPKQVTAQAVVYEYKQTPHNAVSNVHVNQQFQTVSQPDSYKAPPPVVEDRPTAPETAHTQVVYTQYPIQHHVYHPQPNIPLPPAPYPLVPVRAESVAIPVHHRTIVHHGFHPIQTSPNQPQPNPNLGKYLYVNGKIIYHPAIPAAPHSSHQAGLHNGNTGNNHAGNVGNSYSANSGNAHLSNPYPGNTFQGNSHPANTYPANVYPANTYPANGHPYQPVKTHQQPYHNPVYNPHRLSGKLTPPAAKPLTYHYQNHHKPSNVKLTPAPEKPVHKDEEDEEEEKENIRNQDKEDDDHESYENEEEEEEEFKPYISDQYRSDDDDEDDHSSYQVAEDDEEDNERGSSKYVKSKPKKYNKSESKPFGRYATSDNYKYKEGYKSNTRYGKPFYSSKEGKGKGGKPKTHYKAYKYSRKGDGKPKIEMIEGKHSQNVPIVHNQKFFKEKWFVSNSHEE